MLTLARYTLKGPYHAATVVGLLAIGAVFFPLLAGNAAISVLFGTVLTVLACALVGLIILTQGIVSGLKSIIVAILGITLVTTVVIKAPHVGLAIALAQWLPIIVLAQTLRMTRSLPMMMYAAVALSGVAIVLRIAIWPELEASWLQLIQLSMEQLKDYPGYEGVLEPKSVELFVHWMVLVLPASMFVLLVGVMMLARKTQARIAESKGFSEEFAAFALGKWASIGALLLIALGMQLKQDWLTSLSLVIGCAFLFQGIAVVHARAAATKYKAMLLGLFYALLLIFPQFVAITAITGMMDNWLVFRKKTATKTS